MNKILASLGAVVTIFGMVACGSGGGGGVVNQIPTCPGGYVFNTGTNSCIVATGVAPVNTVNQFYDYNRYLQGAQFTAGDMQIRNQAAFKHFLKEAMGLCDRNIWGVQYGLASCDSWVAGSFRLMVRVDASLKPVVSFEAYPEMQFYSYTLSFGIDAGGMAFNPLTLSQNNTFSLINDSKGFEIRANGSYLNGGGLRLIQIQVHQGTLNDGYFTYKLFYPYNNVATEIATGKLKRY